MCAHWRPQYLLVSSEYLDLSVEVELGPEECEFNTFRISVPTVTDHNSGSPSGFTDFDVVSVLCTLGLRDTIATLFFSPNF